MYGRMRSEGGDIRVLLCGYVYIGMYIYIYYTKRARDDNEKTVKVVQAV
jgi:hypothetical protein